MAPDGDIGAVCPAAGCTLAVARLVVPARGAATIPPAAMPGGWAVAVPLAGGLTCGGAVWPALEPRAVPDAGIAVAGAAGPVLVMLLRHGPDVALYAIGSRVRGKAGAGSDLDLLALVRAPVRAEHRWGALSLSLQPARDFRAARAAGDPFAVTVAAAHRRLSGWRDPVGRAAAAHAAVPCRPDIAAALAVARACLRPDVAARAPGPAADKRLWAARTLLIARGIDPFADPPPAARLMIDALANARRDPRARPAAEAMLRGWLARDWPAAAAPDPRPLEACLAELAASGGLAARMAAALRAGAGADPAPAPAARTPSCEARVSHAGL